MKKTALWISLSLLVLASCKKGGDAGNSSTGTGTPTGTGTTANPSSPLTTPAIQWQLSLGGDKYDAAKAIKQTSDGGYIAVGYTYSTGGDVTLNHGADDYWVVKLNNSGKVEWQKTYGGSRGDEASCVIQTTDGGYLVGGFTLSNDGDVSGNQNTITGNAWIIKLSATGSLQWQKCYASNQLNTNANEMIQTADGGYLIGGNGYALFATQSYADFLVLKIAGNGDLQWSLPLGGGYHDTAYSIAATVDGGAIVVGNTFSTDGIFKANHATSAYSTCDAYIVKLNAKGGIDWQKIYGGTNNDEARSVRQTTDGGYVVAGYTTSTDGDVVGNHSSGSDYWVLKLSPTGTIQWQKCLGAMGDESAYAVQQSADGGFVLAGSTRYSNDGDITDNHALNNNSDYWIVKTDGSGNIIWKKSYGGPYDDSANAISGTSDGGLIVAGQSSSLSGDVSGNHGDYDAWIVKLK